MTSLTGLSYLMYDEDEDLLADIIDIYADLQYKWVGFRSGWKTFYFWFSRLIFNIDRSFGIYYHALEVIVLTVAAPLPVNAVASFFGSSKFFSQLFQLYTKTRKAEENTTWTLNLPPDNSALNNGPE